ncbi:hypothetical protein TH15_19720 [Thalassospira profundimaris]|uniref:Uncharacterized protein n=1 Tax=Thalassospira indica TaxID=1891279 RepID=A0ABM6XY24_9PROT|nr:hypothetical protein DY252_10550 [Thalassospira indica]OAZ10042.1 hypothetical protein TH15_19720 [Thalassospira profundimaris]
MKVLFRICVKRQGYQAFRPTTYMGRIVDKEVDKAPRCRWIKESSPYKQLWVVFRRKFPSKAGADLFVRGAGRGAGLRTDIKCPWFVDGGGA